MRKLVKLKYGIPEPPGDYDIDCVVFVDVYLPEIRRACRDVVTGMGAHVCVSVGGWVKMYICRYAHVVHKLCTCCTQAMHMLYTSFCVHYLLPTYFMYTHVQTPPHTHTPTPTPAPKTHTHRHEGG